MTETRPKGFTCECGGEHRFPREVYEHWDLRFTHDCDCGRQHQILRGEVLLTITRRAAPTDAGSVRGATHH